MPTVEPTIRVSVPEAVSLEKLEEAVAERVRQAVQELVLIVSRLVSP